jgi:5-formyltetrahydrofolate cyclo-ligase
VGENRRVEPAAKAQLRRAFSAARQARDADEIERARTEVATIVLQRCARDGWACVAAYLPLPTEPGSLALLAGLRARGVRVLVPVLLPDRDLDWSYWDGAGSPIRPVGVDAIATADAVLVPALAVARDGVRLGRGGGSYDRALSRAAPGAPRAALLYDGELVDALPADPWDVPVTDVVTPAGWRRLAAAADGGRLDAE